ncbi:MAG: esterase family protein [Alphaproteobacteria bacterium]|jgi:esterase/lipase superfamily enzyme
MKEEYFKEYSSRLNRDMEFKVYGHTGKPVLVFPPGSGRFWHYEFHGMVNICAPYIDAGRIQLYCVDGIDWETWDDKDGNPYDRIRRQEQYFLYVTEEFIPRIKGMSLDANGGREVGLMATGCSMGATHSAITFFRRPDLIDSVIALSGLYGPRYFMGDYMDEIVYINSPLAFLPNLTNERLLDQMRQARLAFCVGQGAWEDPMIEETLALKHILEEKHIPAFVDVWGKDVNHDWDWWYVQMPYFLDRILD